MTSKTRKRITAIIVTLALSSSFVLCGGKPVAAEETNNLSKIDPALSERMEAAANYEKIPVTLWVQDISVSDTEIEAETVQNAEALLASPQAMAKANISDDLSEKMALVSARTHARRTLYAEKYAESNEAILEHLLSVPKIKAQKVTLENDTTTWVSHYSPVIKMSLTKVEIHAIKADDAVEGIFLDEHESILLDADQTDGGSITPVSMWQETTNVSYLQNLGYTGKGVKIGIVDGAVLKYSLMDSAQKAAFSALNSSGRLISDPTPSVQFDADEFNHAARCASILVGSSTKGKGVAPEATLYSTTDRGGGLE